MTAEIRLMEARVLYNLMNRVQGVDRQPVHLQRNFLVIVDARSNSKTYEVQHIRGAIRPRDNATFPPTIDVSSVRYCVVYDTDTTHILPTTEAYNMAEGMAQSRGSPVYILKGGISNFVRQYLFLGDTKSLYMPKEQDDLQMWPLDMYDYLLFTGTLRDAQDESVTYKMALRAVVVLQTAEESEILESPSISSENFLRVVIPPKSSNKSLYDSLQIVSQFIDSYVQQNLRVLVASRTGCIITATFVMAYLISKKFTLKKAHDHVTSCDPLNRPGRSALQDLSRWEESCHGECKTELVLPL